MLKAVLRLVLHPGADMEAITRYLICVNGRDRLLRGEISFLDYCDILQSQGVNVDDYADDIEWNLTARGLG